jgi:hypothetical protein
MANYVERDGDWVLRPPGRLEQITMHLFILRAGAAQLKALCDKFINVPSGGAVTAAPLFAAAPFVLLTVADIKKGFSKDPDDAGHGWMTERDVGFFVPATLTWPGHSRVANLLPYLYVNNFPAVMIGRDVFGFPKVLADIAIYNSPWKATVTSTVQVASNPAQPAGPGVVIDVTRHTALPGLPLPGMLNNALAAIAGQILQVLGETYNQPMTLATIPMAFLKQFRDVSVRTAACHQSVVLGEAKITAFNGGEVWVPIPLTPFFDISIPAYHSVNIGSTLGLTPTSAGGHTYRPLLAVRVEIDFELGFGTTLWTAP